jgi:hypothetical protein
MLESQQQFAEFFGNMLKGKRRDRQIASKQDPRTLRSRKLERAREEPTPTRPQPAKRGGGLLAVTQQRPSANPCRCPDLREGRPQWLGLQQRRRAPPPQPRQARKRINAASNRLGRVSRCWSSVVVACPSASSSTNSGCQRRGRRKRHSC